MNKKCIGCGIPLQSEYPDQVGYTPKHDAVLCQRCFRITHYDDVVVSMKQGIDPYEVLQEIQKKNALILWVVDLFDFEANMVTGMNRHLMGKDIILIATKRDLLPATLGDEKLVQFIRARLNVQGIVVKGIVLCGNLMKQELSSCQESIDEVEHAIAVFREGRDVLAMGMANAGKSTLLNAMCGMKSLTTSRHPGTTLAMNEIKKEDYIIYDTPGLTRLDSLLTHVDDALLKTIIPHVPLKPISYQLQGNQTLSLAGLVRLDLMGCAHASCVAYFSERLRLHRSKQEKADTLWQTHMGELLSPAIGNDPTSMQSYTYGPIQEKLDVVIHGLGWFCVRGQVDAICVYIPQNGNVTFRKAMI